MKEEISLIWTVWTSDGKILFKDEKTFKQTPCLL